MKFRLTALLALSLAACGGGNDKAPATTEDPVGQPEAIDRIGSQSWAISTANRHATEAGARVLRAGGDATDAAVAVQAVLGLVEPQSSGLGGGGFMLYYDAEAGEVTSYDGREVAPFSVGENIFLDEDRGNLPRSYPDIIMKGHAVGVPATVALLDLAHREHGRLDWAFLFEDAIQLAKDGFEMSPRMAEQLESRSQFLVRNENARALYFDENSRPLTAGTTVRNEPYAQTLEAIAEGGAGAFYSGEIAQMIVDAVNERAGEGHMTPEDIFEYEAIARDPVCGMFVTYKICTMGPPSSALAVIQILGTLEAKGLPEEPGPALWTLYGEAGRLAFADRAKYLGDPSAMGTADIDGLAVATALVEPEYLATRASLIGDAATEEALAGDPFNGGMDDRAPDTKEDVPGTSHFSIRDAYGNIVSMTGTVEGSFGSWIVAGGMILNNELTDFAFEPEIDGEPVVNAPGAGKRPRSSMSPVIVLNEDGAPLMAIGSAGGADIISHVAKTLLLSLGYDLDLQDAVNAPHVAVRQEGVVLENGMTRDVIEAVRDFGLDYRSRNSTSSLHGFRIDDGDVVQLAADPRREGTYQTGTLED